MHEARGVRGRQRGRDLHAQAHHLLDPRPFRGEVAQGTAPDHFHHDGLAIAALEDLEDCDDARMVEGGEQLRLAAEALERLRVVRNLVRQELQRDAAPEPRVLRRVNHAHSACAQTLDDAVLGEGAADHEPSGMAGARARVTTRSRL